MLVTLLVKFRNKDCKTTELGLLLQILPVRIVLFVETLGSHLKPRHHAGFSLLVSMPYISLRTNWENLLRHQDNSSLVIISPILMTFMCYNALI